MIGFALLLGGALSAVPAAAETAGPRVALVIGNSRYGGEIGDLANPANDARLMAETLRKLGFTVIERIDADQKQMQRAVVDFGKSLSQAGSEATGLFYYAGHGLQVDGENYLIPVNAAIKDERDVEVEAVASNLVLKQMDFAGNAVNIVILDACRNNPLSRSFRSQVSGLAEPRRKPRGSFIAYSTAPGDVAADGASRNSPYTRALVDAIQKPGAALEEIFRDVRSSVMAATQQKQVPWDSSSLTAPFYFIPPTETAAAEAPVAPAPAPSGDSKAVELAYWNSIANSSNPAMFERYLKRFPNGEFADLAAAKLEELQQSAAAEKTRTPETRAEPDLEIAELDATYVAVQGANIRAAPSTDAKIVARLKADDPVLVTGQVKGKDWYRVESETGAGFVNMTLLAQADANEIAEWRDLKATPGVEATKAFLAKHPDGYFKPKAEALLASLQQPSPAPAPAPATTPSPAPAPAAAAGPAVKAGQVLRDCGDCPEMVVVPAGVFVMGAATGETGNYTNESPQRQVAIKAFAVAKFEATIGDFGNFLQQSGYDAGSGCYVDSVNVVPTLSWKNPGFSGYAPGARDPVACVDWNAAQAYAAWLSKKTGRRYRLLTEAEFEYATRAGSTGFFPWGIDANQACAFANIADATAMRAPWWQAGYTGVNCNDGASYTTSVGRYQPNAFGLYDMIGNVAEWVADCYFDGYASAPADGSAVDVAGCQQRALRGGSWGANPYLSRSAARIYAGPSVRVTVYGFRVARDL
ncbi:SUMF1/EgtB/PvdO family nonheme iron enzyme [Dongia sp.]|uniref:SUMF1/EgtB/PvdO family nonheme iron enzyme n=1 Tax=Dongia sp. TaxID=1977262 RepID=UPI003752669C